MPRAHIRKRFRRRRGKRVFARKRFARRVRSILLKATEPKKLVISTGDGGVLAEGDGTSRTILVQNIVSNMAQGVQKDQFIGDQVFLKGVGIFGQVSITTGTGFNPGSLIIRLALIWSRVNASGMTGSGVTYGNTTTAAANPTQAPPLANPVFFEGAGNLAFTGDGFMEPFDSTNCKVIAVKTYNINMAGSTNGIKKIKHFFPIRSRYQFLDPLESDLSTPPNYGKYGSYYLIRQVIGHANTIANTELGRIDSKVILYYKDI